MAILSGKAICAAVNRGDIQIAPYNDAQLNPNSYDVQLDRTLRHYDLDTNLSDSCLDVKKDNRTKLISIPEDGWILYPGVLYLGNTIEEIFSPTFVTILDGKSSLGRLGLQAHATAGFLDVGFRGQVTLELTVTHPLRIYAGMRVAQIRYETIEGEVTLYNGKYQDQYGPVASRSYRDFESRPLPGTTP